MKEIDDFVELLSQNPPINLVVNQYSLENNNNEIRRRNLKKYLLQMFDMKPKYLLVGEAPGYKGCAISGVPFTDELTIKNGLKNINLFGIKNGYGTEFIDKELHKENTAQIFWNLIDSIGKCEFLIWNIFPFHPHERNDIKSNRKPTAMECSIGKKYVFDLLKIFGDLKIVSIGRVAEENLKDKYNNIIYIRHPSYGGKNEFETGIRKLYEV